MSIHVIADHIEECDEICNLLRPQFLATRSTLRSEFAVADGGTTLIVIVDLRSLEAIEQLQLRERQIRSAKRRLFVVKHKSHLICARAYALGANSILPSPVSRSSLLEELGSGGDRNPAYVSDSPESVAADAAVVIKSLFTSVIRREPVDISESQRAGSAIASSISEGGLSEWLRVVRLHHEGTFQHCLLVTGVSVDFGLHLGLNAADLKRLYTAAMLHDIGKAAIPRSILDKPGRLDQAERATIETHPGLGYECLVGVDGASTEILDCVRHHHEFLDGSGYPDGLCGDRITDLVRILTISDIFSALIERRPYKPALPRSEGYEILSGMKDKLEIPLLVAFRDVALTR